MAVHCYEVGDGSITYLSVVDKPAVTVLFARQFRLLALTLRG